MSPHDQHSQQEEEFSFKNYFVPLTTSKAIHFIIILGLIVYFNSLFNGFVWDDKPYIINYFATNHINFLDAFKPNFFNTEGQYRPIPVIYFSLLFSLFGDQAFFYHFVQLIIHLINTILFFYFFNKLLNKNIALFLSLIFLTHPMQVESVSYISAAGNPLFYTLGFSSLILSMKPELSIRRIIAIIVLLTLSILTRETGVLFVFLAIIYRGIFQRKNFFRFALTVSSTIGIYLVVRLLFGKIFFSTEHFYPITNLTFRERLLNVPSIFYYYISSFFLPAHFIINQQWIVNNVNFNSFYFPLVIDTIFLVLTIVFGAYLLRINKKIFFSFLFFFFWFYLGMLFHLQFFPLDMTVADRWFYLPMVGLLGMMGIELQEAFLKIKKMKNIAIVFGFIIIIIFSLRTIVRNTNWVDALTLYRHDAQYKTNFELENNLAGEYEDLGKTNDALIHYKLSIAMFPYEVNLYNLGHLYEKTGNKEKAIKLYSQALTKPHYSAVPQKHLSITSIRLAYVLLSKKEYMKAISVISHALAEYPTNKDLWSELAYAQYKLGNKEEALKAAKHVSLLSNDLGENSLYNQILKGQKIDIK